jgi:hypothetical protein
MPEAREPKPPREGRVAREDRRELRLCMDEGALSFVTAVRYPIRIFHTSANWKGE